MKWGAGEPRRRTTAANWKLPHKWNKQAEAEGRRFKVFCASLADVFDNSAPVEWRRDLFSLIELTPNLDWLLLTKRIGNVADMVREARSWDWMLGAKNVWLGATIVNREEMLRDAPKLKAVPARVRFWSVEPMLGDIGEIPAELMPDWVIAGGESGPGARPMLAEWALDLRDQCAAAGVPFLFKQWGEWTPGVNVERVRGVIPTATFWDGQWLMSTMNLATDHGHRDDEPDLYRVGKKDAGRVLDGVTHDGFPGGADSRTLVGRAVR